MRASHYASSIVRLMRPCAPLLLGAESWDGGGGGGDGQAGTQALGTYKAI